MSPSTKPRTPAPDEPTPAARGLRRWREGDRVLLLAPEIGRWLIATPVGADIIDLCDGRNTPRLIARALADTYGADEAAVQADVVAFLSELDRVGFLKAPLVPATLPPDGLALHMTSGCGLRCRHCYASPVTPAATEPPLAMLQSAVAQARALGATSVKLTGGDPLCRPEALEALAEPLAGMAVTVLTAAVAPYGQVRGLLDRAGWQLQVSLDGADAATHDWFRGQGAFSAVTANLAALGQEGLGERVRLSVCLSRVNQDQIEGVIGLALQWGVRGVHLVRVSHQGRAAEHWRELDQSPEQWRETYERLARLHGRYHDQLRLTGFLADYLSSCVAHPSTRGCALGRQVMMDLDGGVYPCIMMTRPEDRLGNLHHQTLAACLQSERLEALRQACQDRLADEAVCGRCDWRMVCRGACPGWAVAQGQALGERDELCALRQKLLPQLILGHAGKLRPDREPSCPS